MYVAALYPSFGLEEVIRHSSAPSEQIVEAKAELPESSIDVDGEMAAPVTDPPPDKTPPTSEPEDAREELEDPDFSDLESVTQALIIYDNIL